LTSHQSVTVIGAGISGLTAARRLLQARPELGVTVIDAGTRSGGMVETEHWQGLTIDHGPEGVITTKPEALDLIDALGMTEDLVVSGPAPRRTFIARDGQLRPLPYGSIRWSIP
jgi:oxygen-dependent protoporphyrinogen oxidase